MEKYTPKPLSEEEIKYSLLNIGFTLGNKESTRAMVLTDVIAKTGFKGLITVTIDIVKPGEEPTLFKGDF